MEKIKDFYRNLDLPNNYKWFGFIDGYHHFQRKAEDKKGWYTIKCLPEDIESGNIHDMARLEVTL